MAFILNKFDCDSAIKGTGTRGCFTDINVINRLWLVESGTAFNPATDTFNDALVNGLVQDGKLVILPVHVNFTNNTAETVYETYANTGLVAPVRRSPIDFTLAYQNGSCFSQALFSLSAKKWDVFMIDYDDNYVSRLWGAETSVGDFRGFEANLVYLDSKFLNDGAAGTKSNLRVQLNSKGTANFYSSYSYLTSDTSISFDDYEGVNDLTLTATDLSAAGVKIAAFEGCGGSSVVSSLDNVNLWRVLDNTGAAVTLTAVTFANGVYTLTSAGFVAASTYTFEVYDSVNSKSIVAVEGVYYDSPSLELTLA